MKILAFQAASSALLALSPCTYFLQPSWNSARLAMSTALDTVTRRGLVVTGLLGRSGAGEGGVLVYTAISPQTFLCRIAAFRYTI